ncbi:MAG: ABC transporter permease [SAR324 cluster bacterium]|nr:ABC transporter permease [SAR324 cluster bacterium]
MQRLILIRLVEGMITLLIMSMVIFFVVRQTGSPIDLYLPAGATSEQIKELERIFGLDRPLPVQYYSWLWQVLQGNLGISYQTSLPVSQLIAVGLPNSVKLATVALVLAMIPSVMMGVWAAVHRGRTLDYIVRTVAVFGQSVPGFWLGLMLIQLFAVNLGILPVAGMGTWKHYIMPSMTLGTWALAAYARLLRSSMLEVLDTDYILLARIKGVPKRGVIWNHALRNALIPVVTFTGVYFSLMITAGVVTETVFAWPGMGLMLYDAIKLRDFPVVQGMVLVSAAIVIVFNLIVDVLYGYLDPRIRLGGASGGK